MIFLGCLWAMPNWAAPPQVVTTLPAQGASAVPLSVQEVVVTFDQDMDQRGFSFMGGGESFPKIVTKPFWRSARECVLPVQLEPARTYQIGLNGPTKGNFKNLAGELLPQVILRFSTAGGTLPPVPQALQTESIRQLKEALETRYSYRDIHPVDWTAQWREFEPRLMAATSTRAFALIAGQMLAATQDPHIWLMEGGQIVPAFQRAVEPNINWPFTETRIKQAQKPHAMVVSGTAAPGIGYLAVHSWQKNQGAEIFEAARKAMTELQTLPGLILDVRTNSGGDETTARKVAGLFIQKRALYAKHQMHGSQTVEERWLEPNPDGPFYRGRVIVLMGPLCMSSCEAFLLMMRQVPGCRLVGAPSYGSSGNPQPHELANRVTVFLPSWRAMLPDGTVFEGRGLTPDVLVRAEKKEFWPGDPVLDKAVELLKSP